MILLDIEPSREYFLGLFRKHNLKPWVYYRSPSLETVRGFVASGMGYSILITQPKTNYDYNIPSDQTMVGKYLQVVVSSTDSLGGTGTLTATTASVANVNDAPTNLTLDNSTVNEDVGIGSLIGSFLSLVRS